VETLVECVPRRDDGAGEDGLYQEEGGGIRHTEGDVEGGDSSRTGGGGAGLHHGDGAERRAANGQTSPVLRRQRRQPKHCLVI
jgi:hypothetical protein